MCNQQQPKMGKQNKEHNRRDKIEVKHKLKTYLLLEQDRPRRLHKRYEQNRVKSKKNNQTSDELGFLFLATKRSMG